MKFIILEAVQNGYFFDSEVLIIRKLESHKMQIKNRQARQRLVEWINKKTDLYLDDLLQWQLKFWLKTMDNHLNREKLIFPVKIWLKL